MNDVEKEIHGNICHHCIEGVRAIITRLRIVPQEALEAVMQLRWDFSHGDTSKSWETEQRHESEAQHHLKR